MLSKPAQKHTNSPGSSLQKTNLRPIFLRKKKTYYGRNIFKNAPNNTFFSKYPFTFKELDKETGLYYYGSRYLDPKISRWLSIDPALTDGSYIPVAPNGDEARKHNQNLPGMGGVFNYVNLHVYHYSANNPVKYIDPDGREFLWQDPIYIDQTDFNAVKAIFDDIIENDTTAVGDRFRELASSDKIIKIVVIGERGANEISPGLDGEQWSSENKRKATNGKGTDSTVYISTGTLRDNRTGDVLAHEIAGHAYDIAKGTLPGFRNRGRIKAEENAVAMQNLYLSTRGRIQRSTYEYKGTHHQMPRYSNGRWFLRNREWSYHQ